MKGRIDPVFDGWPVVWRTEEGYEIDARFVPLRYITQGFAVSNCVPDFPRWVIISSTIVLVTVAVTFLGGGFMTAGGVYILPDSVADWFYSIWTFVFIIAGTFLLRRRFRLFYRFFIKDHYFDFEGNQLIVSDDRGQETKFDLTEPHSYELVKHSLAEMEDLNERSFPKSAIYAYRLSFEIFFVDTATGARRRIIAICGKDRATAIFNRLRQIDRLYASGEEPNQFDGDRIGVPGDYGQDLEQALRLFNLNTNLDCRTLERRYNELSHITAPEQHGSQALLDQVKAAYAILKRGYGCE